MQFVGNDASAFRFLPLSNYTINSIDCYKDFSTPFALLTPVEMTIMFPVISSKVEKSNNLKIRPNFLTFTSSLRKENYSVPGYITLPCAVANHMSIRLPQLSVASATLTHDGIRAMSASA